MNESCIKEVLLAVFGCGIIVIIAKAFTKIFSCDRIVKLYLVKILRG